MKWYARLARYPEVWLLTGLAVITRLWQIGLPPAIVFDEVYFRMFAAGYVSGHYFFDIHPPFVKLIFTGVASLAHLSAEQIASGDPGGILLRSIPALAGAALVPLLYVIIRQLGLGRRVATFGALLVLLDNALLVESRFVLMDSLLLLFGFGALSCYLALRRRKGNQRWVWVVFMAALLGMLVSTKWSGLAMAGLIAVTWFIEGVLRRADWRRMVGEFFVTIFIVASIYIGSFMLHFTLLNSSGAGDAFMSEKFQSTLVSNSRYNASARMSQWEKIVELNSEMYTAQDTLTGVQHPYASHWYSWPLQIRPVYYWQGETQKTGTQGNIYLIGNPVVWWLCAVSVITGLLIWLIRPQLLGHRRRLVAFLLAGYALNFVPFAFIDRPMFLYHYFFALIFSMLVTCVLLAQLFDWQRQKYGIKAVKQTFWGLVIAVALGFLYFLPLSYGWLLSPADLQQRMWLPTWR